MVAEPAYQDDFRSADKRRDMSPMIGYDVYTNNPLGSAKVEKKNISTI